MPRTIEEIRKAKREHMAKRRAADPERARAIGRAHHSRHREQNCARLRDYYARRFFWGRAMKLRGTGRATHRQVASLWKQQRGRCGLTGRRMDRTAQLDHILPKARGGNDSIENLRWVCEEVNIAKRHMTDEEFGVLCGDVIRWIGKRVERVVKAHALRKVGAA